MARVSVAGIQTFIEGSKGRTVHVGVDVHKRSYIVALLRSDGAWKEWTTPIEPEGAGEHAPAAALPDRGRGLRGGAHRIRAGPAPDPGGDSRDRCSSQPNPTAGGSDLQDRPTGRSQAGRIRRYGHAPSHCCSDRDGGRVPCPGSPPASPDRLHPPCQAAHPGATAPVRHPGTRRNRALGTGSR